MTSRDDEMSPQRAKAAQRALSDHPRPDSSGHSTRTSRAAVTRHLPLALLSSSLRLPWACGLNLVCQIISRLRELAYTPEWTAGSATELLKASGALVRDL